MKNKIAFISEHASPLAILGGVDSGGQNVYVDQVARHLAELEYEVDIYTRWDSEAPSQIIEYSPGVRVIHIEAGPKKFIPKEELFQYMDEFAAGMMKFIESQNIKYELIHAHFWMSGYVAAMIKYMLNIPFVITFHALGKVRRIYQGTADGFPDLRFRMEEIIIKHADMIIAECPQDKEDLMFLYYADEEKIRIVPCGFDPEEFYPVNKREAKIKLGLNPDEKVILQLGRMVPRKGVDNVIRGMAYLLTKKNIPLKLVIVGGESDQPDAGITPEIGRLQEIAKEENVTDRTIFAGRKGRSQLRNYYNAADIFISTPWYEPFGITPLESMACGTPVIGSNVGGIKFSVCHGKTGFLVPPKDPEILGQRILDSISNKNLLKELSSQAMEHVNKFFTWKIVAAQIMEVYAITKNNNMDFPKRMRGVFFKLIDSFRIGSRKMPRLISE
jgi:D-inositol-3-phosphate glycosyltransferase